MASNDTTIQAAETIGGGSSPLNSGAMFEMVIGLALVVAVILACGWVYKRMGGFDGGVGGVIKVIAGLSLGSRDRIALVEVGEKKILLGISPGRINTLHVFEPSDDFGASASIGSNKTGSDFAGKLQSLLNRQGRPSE